MTDVATVLVVEDEALIRMDMVDCLEEAGFSVLEADDADAAIAILESRTDIRLVLTDIDMPGSIDGLKLAAAVRDRWPPVQIIVTSGHVTPAEHQLPKGSRFFAKPYSRPDVARAVHELMRP